VTQCKAATVHGFLKNLLARQWTDVVAFDKATGDANAP
jgi:hypothetical protein